MNKSKFFLASLLLSAFATCIQLNAQNRYSLPQITPKSPNAASFSKYGEVPVSLGTGRANIDIDLYTLTSGSISLPMNLAYHNNGLQVDEIPSWIGLGWDLKVGGMITFQQKGLYDFDPNYGLFSNNHLQNLNRFLNGNMSTVERYEYLERVMNGQEDSEFDIYHFNFLGHNGSFYFDANQNIIVIPKQDLQILKTINGFAIKDNIGNQFFFEAKEYSSMMPLSGIELRPSFTENSVFYISKILTSNNRQIRFKYINYGFSHTKSNRHITYMSGYAPCPGSTSGISESSHNLNYLLLDSIITDESLIKFVQTAEFREDIKKINGFVPSLKSIVIKTIDNQIIRQFDFATSYFGSNDRLKLVSIQERNGLSYGRKWSFEYHYETASFPSFFSLSKDHWGYYNAAVNSTGIPKASYKKLFAGWNNWFENITTAERSSNSSSSLIGTLKKITFPTGGTTLLEYESNQLRLKSYREITELSPFLLLPANVFNINIPESVLLNAATNNNSVSGSFTINQSELVNIISLKQLSSDGFFDADIYVNGPEPSAGKIQNIINSNCSSSECLGNDILELQAGSYSFLLQGGSYYDGGNNYISVNASLKIVKETVNPYIIGGHRIAKISNNDLNNVNTMIKKFIYNDSLNAVNFRNIPNYYTGPVNITTSTGSSCNPCGAEYKIHDENVIPSAGSFIEYKHVTELFDESGSGGKIESQLSFSQNIGGSYVHPFSNPINTSWRSGNPQLKRIFKKTNNSFELIQLEENNFLTSELLSITNGIKVDYSSYCLQLNGVNFREHSISLSTAFTEQFYPSEKNTTIIKNNYQLVNNVKFYHQSLAHLKTDLIERNTSKGGHSKQKTIFSLDYNTSTATTPEAEGIKNLKLNYIILPIETISIETIAGIDYVVDGSLTTYRSNVSVIDKVFSLKINVPILLSSFILSHINSNGNFVKDGRYEERLNSFLYDNYLNTLQQQKSNDVLESYIWGYKNQLPVAIIVGAPYSSAINLLNPSIIQNPVDDVQLRTELNKLRQNLPGALVKTYTYKPLIGMTSSTDENGRTIYYEYNGLGRLTIIKDKDNNVIKKYCYNYQGQVENCNN